MGLALESKIDLRKGSKLWGVMKSAGMDELRRDYVMHLNWILCMLYNTQSKTDLERFAIIVVLAFIRLEEIVRQFSLIRNRLLCQQMLF